MKLLNSFTNSNKKQNKKGGKNMIGTIAGIITIFVAGGALFSQTDIGFDMEMAKDIGHKILDTVKVWTN